MKKIIYSLAAFLISISLISDGRAETAGFKRARLMPRDDSQNDAGFSHFIKNFRKDIKDKNLESVTKSIAPDVRWTFGDEKGVTEFLKRWELDRNPEKSGFWDEMEKVLSAGAAYYNDEKTSFVFPYQFVEFPEDYDPTEYYAVTGNRVNVRKSASSKSPVVETLDYDLVKTVPSDKAPVNEKIDGKEGTWSKIITSSGKEYVFSRYLYSPFGFRAIFEKRGKNWMLTIFISGD